LIETIFESGFIHNVFTLAKALYDFQNNINSRILESSNILYAVFLVCFCCLTFFVSNQATKKYAGYLWLLLSGLMNSLALILLKYYSELPIMDESTNFIICMLFIVQLICIIVGFIRGIALSGALSIFRLFGMLFAQSIFGYLISINWLYALLYLAYIIISMIIVAVTSDKEAANIKLNDNLLLHFDEIVNREDFMSSPLVAIKENKPREILSYISVSYSISEKRIKNKNNTDYFFDLYNAVTFFRFLLNISSESLIVNLSDSIDFGGAYESDSSLFEPLNETQKILLYNYKELRSGEIWRENTYNCRSWAKKYSWNINRSYKILNHIYNVSNNMTLNISNPGFYRTLNAKSCILNIMFLVFFAEKDDIITKLVDDADQCYKILISYQNDQIIRSLLLSANAAWNDSRRVKDKLSNWKVYDTCSYTLLRRYNLIASAEAK
jgi:hypothetical protein